MATSGSGMDTSRPPSPMVTGSSDGGYFFRIEENCFGDRAAAAIWAFENRGGTILKVKAHGFVLTAAEL